MDNAPHATIDSASPHDSNASSGGDALGLNRDCPSSSSSDAPSNTPSGNSNDHSGGGLSVPTPTHRAHLGWQSLLPGSIQ